MSVSGKGPFDGALMERFGQVVESQRPASRNAYSATYSELFFSVALLGAARDDQYSLNGGPFESGGTLGRLITSGTGAGMSGPIKIASPGARVGRNIAASRSRSPDALSTVSRSCSFVRRWTISVPNWLSTSWGISRGLCVASVQLMPYFLPSFAMRPNASSSALVTSSLFSPPAVE